MTTRSGRGVRGITLAGSVTGAAVVALDGTVLTVVQPGLQRELGATFAQVQWTSTGYLIAVASLLVFAGRLGDRYGHRRLFGLGMLGFGGASAGIGLADSIGWVIGLRVVQGVFGALLQPATLGMLRAAFPPERLGMPIAVRTSAIGLAAATGPVVGGVLAAELSWRAVFFLNVPPALAVGLLVSAAGWDSGRAPAAPGVRVPRVALNLPGAGLLALSLIGFVHSLVSVPEGGWTAVNLLTATVGGAAAVAFVRHERRAVQPLAPPAVLRTPGLAPALALLLTSAAALHGTLFTATYFLQYVLGLDPFECGLWTLPLAATMVLGAPLCAAMARRYGHRRTAGVGAAALTAGVLLLSRLGEGVGVLPVGAAFFLLGAGFAAVLVTGTSAVVMSAPGEHAGVAGGLKQTVMNLGPAGGVALATTSLSAWVPAGRTGHAAFLAAMGPTLTVLGLVALTGLLWTNRLGLPAPRRTVLQSH